MRASLTTQELEDAIAHIGVWLRMDARRALQMFADGDGGVCAEALDGLRESMGSFDSLRSALLAVAPHLSLAESKGTPLSAQPLAGTQNEEIRGKAARIRS